MSPRLLPALFAAVLLAGPAAAQPFGKPELSPFGKKVEAAMASELRTDADRERDANRKPIETLEFFGLEQDMDVLELVPGGGWYTKILGQLVLEKGSLTVAMGTWGIPKLKEQEAFEKIRVIDTPFDPSNRVGNRFDPKSVDLGSKDFDLVLTFRNLHNFTEGARRVINQAAYDALKPGGLYGVVDHTRRHMEKDAPENWRRMDPVLMIHEIQSVGFALEKFSDLHYRSDDELRFEVGRRSVKGNTDRFTLLFRKPE